MTTRQTSGVLVAKVGGNIGLVQHRAASAGAEVSGMIDDDDDDDDGPTATLIETIALELSDKADWRRQKAKQYPDDERNLDAAELLDRLAGEVLALEGLPRAESFEIELGTVFLDENQDRAEDVMRLWSDYRAGIGFRIFPDDGANVLRDMLKLARSTV